MVLGAINPISVSNIQNRITTTASDPAKVQTFATQTSQTYDPSKGVSPIVEQKTDIMDTLKKYAPYLLGAAIVIYLIKNN